MEQSYIQIQYNLYKWGAWDGEYPDTPPFPGYNFFKKANFTEYFRY